MGSASKKRKVFPGESRRQAFLPAIEIPAGRKSEPAFIWRESMTDERDWLDDEPFYNAMHLNRWASWLATAAAIIGYAILALLAAAIIGYAILALLAASQLTACGGGGDDQPEPAHRDTQPPACQANPASCK